MTKSLTKKQIKSKKHFGGNWDGVWSQESTLKQLNFLRKIGNFYLEVTGLLDVVRLVD